MNLTLVRSNYISTGIFGTLLPQDNSFILMTLEHSFQVKPEGQNSVDSLYEPKVPSGSYLCVRGIHQLEKMEFPFETFEVTKVPGHSGILFHSGNTNVDSSGCILLGLSRNENIGILHSRDAFKKFMELQSDVDSFNLTIT